MSVWNDFDKKGLSIFVVSKPLQYLNVLNIEDNNSKICLILNSFDNAFNIYEQIRDYSSHWDKVHFFDNYKGSYSWLLLHKHEIDKLYLDTDFGFRLNWNIRKVQDLPIYLYEEGIGNYRTNIWGYSMQEKFFRFMYSLLLNGKDQLGGSKYIIGMYLYDIEKHTTLFPNYDKVRLEFKKPFLEHILNCEDSKIFFPEVIKEEIMTYYGKKVILYLTSWKYNYIIDEIFLKHDDYVKILKPHPHIKMPELNIGDFDYVIESFVLVEMVILFLSDICSELIVVHENSSAFIPFRNDMGYKNLKEIIL